MDYGRSHSKGSLDPFEGICESVSDVVGAVKEREDQVLLWSPTTLEDTISLQSKVLFFCFYWAVFELFLINIIIIITTTVSGEYTKHFMDHQLILSAYSCATDDGFGFWSRSHLSWIGLIFMCSVAHRLPPPADSFIFILFFLSVWAAPYFQITVISLQFY